MRTISILLWAASGLAAQTPLKLTLADAEAAALKNHPRVSADRLSAEAAKEVTTEVRSSLYPAVIASVTGAGALDNSRLAAGALNNPVIYNRFAMGATVGQLITDFGRTSNLVQSANLRAGAQQQTYQATRAGVLLEVDRAYFAALRGLAVLRVAEETVKARQLVADQVSELARSKLKSGLDVSFANVNLADAKLILVSAQNQMKAAVADLSNAMGYPEPREVVLAEVDMPQPLPSDASAIVKEALVNRPEIASLRLETQAALKFSEAEKDLARPTISAIAAAGGLPLRDEDKLRGRYAAAGINLSIPVFNGHLFSARFAEADLRARASEQRLRDLENRVSRDVSVAFLNATTAFQRMALTRQLLEQANLALDLSQSRYDLGLSSIVELSQAQLNKTNAEIQNASARYDYQEQHALLDYQAGLLR